MDWLETRIPPPLVALAMALLLWGVLAFIAPVAPPPTGVRTGAALAVAGVGLAIDLWAAGAFLRARTTIHPMHPARSRQLVTTGLYRWTRNPMYVGQALLLAGFAIWRGHPAGILVPLLFAAYITRFQIRPEERILAAKFPQDYAAYRARVRRWL